MKACMVLHVRVIIKDYHITARQQIKHACLMEMGSAEVLQEWDLHTWNWDPTEKGDLITSEVRFSLESSALGARKK